MLAVSGKATAVTPSTPINVQINVPIKRQWNLSMEGNKFLSPSDTCFAPEVNQITQGKVTGSEYSKGQIPAGFLLILGGHTLDVCVGFGLVPFRVSCMLPFFVGDVFFNFFCKAGAARDS